MALSILKKFHRGKQRTKLNVTAVPSLAAITCAAIALLSVTLIAWFGYTKVYTPFTLSSVPEERINQTQEKLNVKDFETVSKALEEKQRERPAAANPF